MKTCPFCAEEIQDAAIKCKHCGSMLVDDRGQSRSEGPSAAGFDLEEPSSPPPPAVGKAGGGREASDKVIVSGEISSDGRQSRGRLERRRDGGHSDRRDGGPGRRALRRAVEPDEGVVGSGREVLYTGHPSWRAFFRHYLFIALVGLGGPVLAYLAAESIKATVANTVVGMVVPFAIAAVWFYVLGLYRRSKIVRVTTTNIETEAGILSRKIDVLELWRCRDVAYHQSFFDRLLGIAHIQIYTADVTTPELRIVGLPASRRLFERIRDSIEIQRQSRNVLGFVE